jgi:hypothetical protein
VDRRTSAGRQLKAFEALLAKQLGGSPTYAQQALITRCAWLQLKCALAEWRMANGVESAYDAATYSSWVGSLARALRILGLKDPPAPTLQRVLGPSAPPPPPQPSPNLNRLPGFRWAEPKADGKGSEGDQ